MIDAASTSSDFYNLATHPRFAHLQQSESRRKSTPPMRIQQVPLPAQPSSSSQEHHNVRVRGVIRDPANAKCLYLLVDSNLNS
jgi:hypothetical protein